MLHSARLPVNELQAQKGKEVVKVWSRSLQERNTLILLPMPPLAKRPAASLAIKLEKKDAIQFERRLRRRPGERTPPMGNSLIRIQGQKLVSKMNAGV